MKLFFWKKRKEGEYYCSFCGRKTRGVCCYCGKTACNKHSGIMLIRYPPAHKIFCEECAEKRREKEEKDRPKEYIEKLRKKQK